MAGLEVDPEHRRRAEVATQAQRGVSSDLTLAMDDLADPSRRYAGSNRDRVQRGSERLDELPRAGLRQGEIGVIVLMPSPR